MTARIDATGGNGPEAALSSGEPDDDLLAIFPREPDPESGDGAARRMHALLSQAPPVPFTTPSVNDGKPPAAGVVNRIKSVVRALDISRDFEKTVDSRLAALRRLDQAVQDRAGRLERLNQEISVGAARADDILREIASFERPLADVRRHKQDLQAIEAAVVDAVEQLRRRAADTIDGLEGRVGDCEARSHVAEQAITRLYDVSSRTLPVLQERTKEAEEQNQSLERLVTEAVRIAAALTALHDRLPAVGQCDQDLARIELAVPQIARQLEDLDAHAEQQIRALAVHQQRVRETFGESQKTAAAVSDLAGRIVDLSGSHQQLDRLETCVTQLEERVAAAAGEVRHATRAKDELQREIANCQQQIERLTTNTLWFLRPNTSRRFSPPRLVFGGAAFALSAAVILLVGIVWRISPVPHQGPEKALPAPVVENRALTLAPTLALAAMPLTADISPDRREVTRTAPSAPAVAVPPVVVSQTTVAATAVPTPAVREQSVTTDAKTPPFVGTLLIESDPAGAAAFVNQEPVGGTPVLLKNLRAGSYVVRLEYQGYQRWSTAATVSAVRHERVRAKLEREPGR